MKQYLLTCKSRISFSDFKILIFRPHLYCYKLLYGFITTRCGMLCHTMNTLTKLFHLYEMEDKSHQKKNDTKYLSIPSNRTWEKSITRKCNRQTDGKRAVPGEMYREVGQHILKVVLVGAFQSIQSYIVMKTIYWFYG